MPWRSPDTIDHMVLFSGDGDFRSLVEAMQRRGVRVTVVSTISTQPPMVADELRRQADIFLDIVELQPKIGRDPAERAAREAREPRERHTPQFLQRPAAPQRAGAGAAVEDDDDFEDYYKLYFGSSHVTTHASEAVSRIAGATNLARKSSCRRDP